MINVTVNYALPTADFNPFADFDLGCTTKSSTANGDHTWNSKARLYRIVSATDWSYAGFYDLYKQLTGSTVAPFEAISRTLLRESLPASHNCTLPGHGGPATPPKTGSTWKVTLSASNLVNNGLVFAIVNYGVNLGSNSPTGAANANTAAFVTKPVLTGEASDITQLELPDIRVNVSAYCTGTTCQAGEAEQFTLHVVNALAFTESSSGSIMLRLAVQMASSTYTPCAAGSSGTLTLTTKPASITLDACGVTNVFQQDSGITPIIDVGVFAQTA